MLTNPNAGEAKAIAFHPAMLAAILAGAKKQTRVVIKPQPCQPCKSNAGWPEDVWHWGKPSRSWSNGERVEKTNLTTGQTSVVERRVPIIEWLENHHERPYRAGDLLYVRESVAIRSDIDLSDKAKAKRYLVYRNDRDQSDNLEDDWHNYGRGWRSPTAMPRWAARTFLRVDSVRVERLQEISEADAIAEGFNRETCVDVFDRAAGKRADVVANCWVEDDEDGFNEGGHYCEACAEKLAKKLNREKKKKSFRVRGRIYMAEETDGPAYCEDCGRVLCVSLTTYGVERELYIEQGSDDDRPRYPVTGRDARIVHQLADGFGDLRDEHLGRLAQIGFATAWNSHGRASGYEWKDNPWVWAIAFSLAEGGAK